MPDEWVADALGKSCFLWMPRKSGSGAGLAFKAPENKNITKEKMRTININIFIPRLKNTSFYVISRFYPSNKIRRDKIRPGYVRAQRILPIFWGIQRRNAVVRVRCRCNWLQFICNRVFYHNISTVFDIQVNI